MIRKIIKNYIFKYWQSTEGVTAIIFALMLPVLLASGGIAVDLAQAYNVKDRLGNAIDKAALAAAGSTGDEGEMQERAEAFLNANFPNEKLGTPYDVEVEVNGNIISITANARVNTKFMQIFGFDTMDIAAFTEVTRDLSGIEVALVLDVTGSMAGTNIAALKSASISFIDIMFERITEKEYLKIGIIPYSSSVNVGSYGWGQNSDGSSYDDGFVISPDEDDYMDPDDLEYDTFDDDQWHGCVLANDYPNDTLDTGTEWEMFRTPATTPASAESCAWERECERWRRGRCRSWGDLEWVCSSNEAVGDPNEYCPRASILPLTNNQAALLSKIDDLEAWGGTLGNYGMIWGHRVISPDFPFTEGAYYDDERWKKAVIMMTDGDNTISNSWYTAYESNSDLDADDLNDRFSEICDNMKEDGITIYTITFESGVDDDTRDIYRECATQETMYYDAPTGAALEEVFEEIANQLSKLHISK